MKERLDEDWLLIGEKRWAACIVERYAVPEGILEHSNPSGLLETENTRITASEFPIQGSPETRPECVFWGRLRYRTSHRQRMYGNISQGFELIRETWFACYWFVRIESSMPDAG